MTDSRPRRRADGSGEHELGPEVLESVGTPGDRGPAPKLSAREQAMRTASILVGSIIITLLLLHVIPYGRIIAYPLLLLSTLVHEMGHGLAALVVGADFEQFVMYADGSGVAVWRGDVGRFGRAFISAGGLVGPACFAALGFAMGRNERRARIALWIFGLFLIAALVLVVRNVFGAFFVLATATICLGVAAKGKPWVSHVVLLFIACQLALSVFSRSDYLFTDEAETQLGMMPSDVARMADALLLPYWFWGGVCGLLSVAILFIGLRASVAKRS